MQSEASCNMLINAWLGQGKSIDSESRKEESSALEKSPADLPSSAPPEDLEDKEVTEDPVKSRKQLQTARREQLQAFLANKKKLEDEKRRKSKPVFKAAVGKIVHPYSAFSSASEETNIHNHSKMLTQLSQSASNLSSLFPNSSRARPNLSRSATCASMSRSTRCPPRSSNPLKLKMDKIDEKSTSDTNRQKSFAPRNFEFKMKMNMQTGKKKTPMVVKSLAQEESPADLAPSPAATEDKLLAEETPAPADLGSPASSSTTDLGLGEKAVTSIKDADGPEKVQKLLEELLLSID